MTEPVSPEAPGLRGRVLMTQGWRDVTFLHWAVEPERVAHRMPPGVRPDTIDGATYVGLIPFRMVGAGLGRGPAVPWLGSFLETNVRLYSVDEQGRRGVVFLSLEAERLLPVLAARWVARLPYVWARMEVRRDGDELTYTSRRSWPGPVGAHSAVTIRVGERLPDPGPLARFLTARWGLHRPGARGPVYWPNEHPEWPLHAAELRRLDESLLAAAGLAGVSGAPDSVLFSPGVDVRFGPYLR